MPVKQSLAFVNRPFAEVLRSGKMPLKPFHAGGLESRLPKQLTMLLANPDARVLMVRVPLRPAKIGPIIGYAGLTAFERMINSEYHYSDQLKS